MSRVATGLVIIALTLIGTLRVLVVTGRALGRAGVATGRGIASAARWMARHYEARSKRQQAILRRAEVLREINRFTNRPRGPGL